MKAKTLVSFINDNCKTYHYSIVKAITSSIGVSGMSLKEAKDYFYGYRGLTMYDVVITSIEKDNQDFYSKL